jgi:hypothetical protein
VAATPTAAPTVAAPVHAKPISPAAAPAHGTPTARPAPAEFVRAYYAALDDHRFADAWKLLSPAVKKRFGTFAAWRAGYATTLANAAGDIEVSSAADGSATVHHILIARDQTKCGGTVEQRFAVTWKLAPTGNSWTVASLSASVAGRAAKTSPCP